ncbi:hypothetical protein FF292_18925, partial [Bordetella pertussis]
QGKVHEHPLLAYLGGTTGAGKTALSVLYSHEQETYFNMKHLAQEAHASVTEDQINSLRAELGLQPNHRIYVRTVPKFTTRDPRSTEHHGVDFYFVTEKEFNEMKE